MELATLKLRRTKLVCELAEVRDSIKRLKELEDRDTVLSAEKARRLAYARNKQQRLKEFPLIVKRVADMRMRLEAFGFSVFALPAANMPVVTPTPDHLTGRERADFGHRSRGRHKYQMLKWLLAEEDRMYPVVKRLPDFNREQDEFFREP